MSIKKYNQEIGKAFSKIDSVSDNLTKIIDSLPAKLPNPFLESDAVKALEANQEKNNE